MNTMNSIKPKDALQALNQIARAQNQPAEWHDRIAVIASSLAQFIDQAEAAITELETLKKKESHEKTT